MLKKEIISSIILFLLIGYSCVPPQQFSELKNEHEDCKQVRDSLKKRTERLTVENTELKARMKMGMKNLDELQKDSIAIRDSLNLLQDEYDQMKNKYLNLKESQESLLKGSERETRQLLDKLQKTQEDLQQREDKLKNLEREIDRKKQNLENLRAEMQSQKARLIELENMLSRKDSIVQAIKDKVSSALVGFEGQGLTVTRKHGKVYISMQEKLLFGTGSTKINADGIQALKKLAGVLEKNTDINVMIEGHTDDQPFGSSQGCINNNWELSVMRAVSVIQILIQHSSIDPSRLTAAGRSKYVPVIDESTPDARRKNRRTEIILTPDLSELYEIIDAAQ